eukprot:8434975-Pyramimonas_sp.AAC.1
MTAPIPRSLESTQEGGSTWASQNDDAMLNSAQQKNGAPSECKIRAFVSHYLDPESSGCGPAGPRRGSRSRVG